MRRVPDLSVKVKNWRNPSPDETRASRKPLKELIAMKKLTWPLLLAALVVFFFVWPGVYRYIYDRPGTSRQDRLTGAYQMLEDDGCWRTWHK